MVLLLHILVALGSLIFTAYSYFNPSHAKVRIAYTGTALTLLSGFYLVTVTGSPILRTCLSGLLYLAVEMAGVIAVQRKLARAEINR